MQPIVVYDTNVLISGMVWGKRPYECIELAKQNKVQGLTCSGILEEFVEKLITKFNLSPIRTGEIVTDLLSFLRPVEIPNLLKGVTADADDDMIIECALVGNATHIVTGDQKHLLPLGNYQGILIVKPADFLAQFQ